MKAIILAAGEGRRLRPYTEDKPKCMVSFQNKAIIQYVLDAFEKVDLQDIGIVAGYKDTILKQYIKEVQGNRKVRFYNNTAYSSTNMVYTLFCAREFIDDVHDLIISYSDIVYRRDVLDKLIAMEGEVCVVADREWKRLWEIRMDNPLDDAETFKIDKNGYIIELGKKPKSYDEIEGQYIGLVKISKSIIRQVIDFYYSLDIGKAYDGKNIQNMYMTTFLQLLIEQGFKLKPVLINGGWVEIDSAEDLENLKEYHW